MAFPSDADDEGALVVRARAGDLSAFELLVARYERRIYNLALRMLGSPADAEDAAQEAFLRAFASLASFRGHARFGTWLYRVAINACRDELRRRRRLPTGPLELADPQPSAALRPDPPDAGPGPEAAAERREVRALVERAVAALPAEYREAVLLRDLHDLSYEEIAAALGVAVGTVKSRIHRGRQLLREQLARWELVPRSGVQPARTGGGRAP